MNRMLSLILLVSACASDGDSVDVSNRDPRCVAACTQREPAYEGVGRVCNNESRGQCLDQCEARIASLPTVCQSCLVEKACFGPEGCDDDDITFPSCTNNTCTVTSSFGSCTFNANDEAARLRCYQQVDPRRESTCTAEFRPTTECANVCT